MLKILQARLQQYVNRELQDDQARFRKGSGTRDQISNICWIIEKAREFQKEHLLLPLDLELFEQRENYIKIDTLHWTILSITLLACEMSAIVQ